METPVLESLFNIRVTLKFVKKRLQDRCFPANIPTYLRTPFFTDYLWWLLLCPFLFKLTIPQMLKSK